MRSIVRVLVVLALFAASVSAVAAGPSTGPADPEEGCEYFDPTSHNLCEPFLSYWQANGGLPVFGYPVTEAEPLENLDTGEIYDTQYFERERLEYHPENTGSPYEILLGRLGHEVLLLQGRDWNTFTKADPSAEHYFAETGHAIAPEFWDYWSTHGLELGDDGVSNRESVALFGYPISPAQMETNSSGDTVLTQWFERARFEFHPDSDPGLQVKLGLLGNEILSAEPPPAPEPPDPDPPTPEPPTPDPPDTPPSGDTFGDGIWLVGEDIEPGIYRSDNTSDFCYWARLSGLSDSLDDIIANEISTAHEIVEIQASDYAFETDGCGTWSTDLSPITESPTAGFGDGKYFVGSEIAPGLWRNSDSSDLCYWARLSGFGGTLDEIRANDIADVPFVVEISEGDTGFVASECGTWTYNPGPITSSPTADISGGTYIVGLDIQAGVWETDSSPEGCYWARLSGFSGELGDIIDNEFIGESDASSQPQRVTISSSDAGFFADSDCGTWHYAG